MRNNIKKLKAELLVLKNNLAYVGAPIATKIEESELQLLYNASFALNDTVSEALNLGDDYRLDEFGRLYRWARIDLSGFSDEEIEALGVYVSIDGARKVLLMGLELVNRKAFKKGGIK